MAKLIHVAAAVILNPVGEILLAKRPDDKHQGGLWEFPGGKVEPGEPVPAALARELNEELGIDVRASRPLIRIPHHYPDKSVLLDVYQVDAFDGEPYGREGQPVRWVSKADIGDYEFPAANKPILSAALLPSTLMITGAFDDAADCVQNVEAGFARGAEGMMLRAKSLNEAEFCELAGAVLELSRQQQRFCSLNTSIELANQLGADAVHLTSERLMALESREQFSGRWISASCHSAEQLEKAQVLGLDFVTLSPVLDTASHPGVDTLGWERFAELVAEVTLPVYALGGMQQGDLEQAWSCGAQGVAAISEWWC